MSFYHSFTEKGQQHLPNKNELTELKKSDIEPVLFLDSCVCLNIIKVVDYKRKATNANIQKVINLKRYLTQSKLKVRPLFGLIELSYGKDAFNHQKFWDFKHRIQFFQSIPEKHFLRFKYDFYRDYYPLKEPQLNLEETFTALESFFLNAYCCLLKIREIALNGLSKRKAEKNIEEFYTWQKNDLGAILGIEFRLAQKILGGSTEFRKMIWLDGKASLVKKKLIGTAWDIFHTRLCTNNFELSRLTGNQATVGYFITNDNLLLNLYANYNLMGVIDKGHELGTMKMYTTDFNIPHLEDDYIDKINRRMIEEMAERFNKPLKNNVEKTMALIVELEKMNNIA